MGSSSNASKSHEVCLMCGEWYPTTRKVVSSPVVSEPAMAAPIKAKRVRTTASKPKAVKRASKVVAKVPSAIVPAKVVRVRLFLSPAELRLRRNEQARNRRAAKNAGKIVVTHKVPKASKGKTGFTRDDIY